MLSRKILIIAPNWIGDAVLSLPVLEACRHIRPEAEVEVLVREGVSEIFSAAETRAAVLEYRRRDGFAGAWQLFRMGRSLRQRGFFLALILPNSLSSALLAALAGITQRLGYDCDGRGLLLTHKLRSRRKERGLHQADYYLQLIHSLGVVEAARIPRLRLRRDLVERGAALLGDLGVNQQEILVGAHPGASYGEAKRWFPERFAAVLDRVHRPGLRTILLGGPGEEQVAGEIVSRMRYPPLDLVGRTSVAEAAALINQCSLFLSNDSGLMHVAAALGIPQVALFGSTDPEKTAPLNERAVVIHPAQVSCTPCFKRQCPQDLECMQAITVDEVYAAVEQLLADH